MNQISIEPCNHYVEIFYALIGLICYLSYKAFEDPVLRSKLIFNAYLVKTKGENLRFLSSGFIHGDWMHLIFNMIALYSFGLNLLYFLTFTHCSLGIVYLILIFLIGVIVSEIPSYFKHQDNIGYNSLGASGGVSSIIFANILVDPLNTGIRIMFLPLPIPSFILGLGYLAYSQYAIKKSNSNINHSAHFWGAIFGVLFMVVLDYKHLITFTDRILYWLNSFL